MKNLILVVLCCFFCEGNLGASPYGVLTGMTDSTPLNANNLAPNYIQGLINITGLNFTTAGSTYQFLGVLPVRGNVNLNSGTLLLSRDLVFEHGANPTTPYTYQAFNFTSPGNIYGSGGLFSVSFPEGFTSFAQSFTFRDVTVQFNGDCTLADALTFQNTCTLDCDGKKFNLGQLGTIYIGAGGNLTIQNAVIDGLSANNVRCMGPTSVLYIKNSVLKMSDTFSFTEGSLFFHLDNIVQGTKVFAFQSPRTMTIMQDSELLIDRNVTFSYDSNAASKTQLIMQDETSVLHLSGCTLYSTRTGLQLQGGTVLIEDKVTVRNEAQVQAEAMVFKSTLTVDVLGAATFDFVGGLIEYQ